MKIRAHHLLCIQGFHGHGYNKEFTVNMSEIIEDLKLYPAQNVQLTADCDIICAYCPHNKSDICTQSPDSMERIRLMDLEVLETIGLHVNTIIKAHDVFQLINKKFKSTDVCKICAKCRWKNECLFFNQEVILKI